MCVHTSHKCVVYWNIVQLVINQYNLIDMVTNGTYDADTSGH